MAQVSVIALSDGDSVRTTAAVTAIEADPGFELLRRPLEFGLAALRHVAELAPAVVIFECAVAATAAREQIAALTAVVPSSNLLALLPIAITADIVQVLLSGNLGGCLAADAAPAEILGLALAISRGERFGARGLLQNSDARPGFRAAPRLSRRELEVLEMMSKGKRSKEIAADLGIGTQTVDTLLRRASEKLGAANRTHAVAEAIRAGALSS